MPREPHRLPPRQLSRRGPHLEWQCFRQRLDVAVCKRDHAECRGGQESMRPLRVSQWLSVHSANASTNSGRVRIRALRSVGISPRAAWRSIAPPDCRSPLRSLQRVCGAGWRATRRPAEVIGGESLTQAVGCQRTDQIHHPARPTKAQRGTDRHVATAMPRAASPAILSMSGSVSTF
jgi:hypothetical protein